MYRLRDAAGKSQPVVPTKGPAVERVKSIVVEPTPAYSFSLPQIDVSLLIGWFLARWYWVLIAAVVGAVIGIGYGVGVKPRYTVYTDILVPPANLQVLPNDIYPQNQQGDTQILDVESKMLVLTSGNVLRRVVTELNLANDPEFVGTEGSGFSLGALFGSSKPAVSDKTLAAIRSLSQRISAKRQERSYLITVSAWANTPDMAVRIADTLAKAFQEEVAQAEADGAGRAASALTDRLVELKKSASDAEAKVADFKRDNGLQTTSGELISSQSMAQINVKLIDANARLVEAQSRYNELTASRPNQSNPSGTLQSQTLTGLRAQYATVKQSVDSMSMTYGPRYPGLIRARSQLGGLEQEISRETGRILRAAQVDLEQAKAVVDALKQQAATARSSVSMDNDAQVRLNDLERDMTTKIAIYQTFLTRAGETTERQQLNSTNIRVISTAVPPMSRSWPPRTALLAAGGGFAGAGFGALLAIAMGLLGAVRNERKTSKV
ncbi:GumC family protein [Phyllobacterium sp. 628]|uniref:GumC family protein n=1 Tax=Phyllobacterium sp. 628 TaxID=2718938 RepID=UPI0016625AE3|nr:GumC family protein [Phyllobacterium sp. 628]QND50828.1 GumC family protein [Phyllobacterium sp. 628]